MAAATAWEVLANGLELASRGYSSVVMQLQDESWSGSASDAMADAAAPFVGWLTTAGAQAEDAAIHARAAAAAYEAAFAATVPPALITANRAQLATLAATNVFGQNAMAIAATEADYAEMWAQDVAAMYGYAASSSVASTLSRFGEPPQTTNAAGQTGQAVAVTQAVGASTTGSSQTTLSRLMSAVPQQLQTLASGGSTTSAAADPPLSLLTAFSSFNTLTAPVNLADGISRTYTSGGSYGYAVKRDIEEHSGPTPGVPPGPPLSVPPASAVWPQTLDGGGVRGQVVASVGRAAAIGGLSVPHGWASTTPVASAVENPQWLSEADLAVAPSLEHSGATNMFSGMPATSAGTRSGMLSGPTVNNVLRVSPRRFTMPRPSLGG